MTCVSEFYFFSFTHPIFDFSGDYGYNLQDYDNYVFVHFSNFKLFLIFHFPYNLIVNSL